jgi:hypothetical protein
MTHSVDDGGLSAVDDCVSVSKLALGNDKPSYQLEV